jgi:hypothetical protein
VHSSFLLTLLYCTSSPLGSVSVFYFFCVLDLDVCSLSNPRIIVSASLYLPISLLCQHLLLDISSEHPTHLALTPLSLGLCIHNSISSDTTVSALLCCLANASVCTSKVSASVLALGVSLSQLSLELSCHNANSISLTAFLF